MSRAPSLGRALAAVAALKSSVAVVATVVGLPVGQALGSGVVLLNLHVLTQGGAGAFLLVTGRGDPRAFPLGVAFLLCASLFSDPLLLGLADRQGAGSARIVEILLHLQVSSFIPLYLWRFIEVFPGPAPYGRVRGVLRVLEGAALVFGVFFLGLHMTQLGLAWGGADATARVLGGAGRMVDPSPFWLFYWILVLPALAVVPWKGATGPEEEARRGRLVLAAVLGGMAPVMLSLLAANLVPGVHEALTGPGVLPWWSTIANLGVLSIPVAVTYAVLVDEALEVRLVVRMAIQHALARYTALALIGGPFLVAVILLVVNRGLPLNRLLTEGPGPLLLACLVMGLALMAGRRRLLDDIDRRFFREQYNARQVLAELAERSRRAGDVEALRRVLEEELGRALHPLRVDLLLRHPDADELAPLDREVRPLAADGVLARRLAARGSVLKVDLGGTSPASAALPEEERHWLVDTGASVLLPLISDDGRLLGVLALGEKRSESPYTAEDLDLLATVTVAASAALQALEEAQVRDVGEEPRPSRTPEPADECGPCGRVQSAGQQRCERCGLDDLCPAEGPLVLHGKYRLLERVGRGGMSIVYRAEDLRLGRDVAIKALPRRTAREIVRLKKEARHIASVSHPNLAVIYEVESWRGTPFLILEFLHGGTLRDRLDRGPLPVAEVVEVGLAVADVLTALHDRALLHRDVKPENVGFSRGGYAKLLDLGIARGEPTGSGRPGSTWAGSLTTTSPDRLVGTVAYLSPEIIRGGPSDTRQDLWASALMLYEALTGQNPFAADTLPEILVRISRAEVEDVRALRPDVPASLADLLSDSLSADPQRRPSSAAALHRRFRSVAADLQSSLSFEDGHRY